METTSERTLLYPIEEALHCLGGIGRSTLYELIADGELERVNIGRRAFITAASLNAYVQRLTGGNVA